MNDAFTLLCASNIVEAQRIKALLEENDIFPIIKDESESARLAGFGSAPMMQQVWIPNSDLAKAKSLI